MDIILSNTTRHVARLITLKTWTKWASIIYFVMVWAYPLVCTLLLLFVQKAGTKLPLCKHTTLPKLMLQNVENSYYSWTKKKILYYSTGVHRSWLPTFGMVVPNIFSIINAIFFSLAQKNVYQFMCTKQNVQVNSEVHRSLQNLYHVSLLGPRIWRCPLNIWKICKPLVQHIYPVHSHLQC